MQGMIQCLASAKNIERDGIWGPALTTFALAWDALSSQPRSTITALLPTTLGHFRPSPLVNSQPRNRTSHLFYFFPWHLDYTFKMALDSFFHNKIESMKLEIIQGQAVLRRLEAQRNDYNSRGTIIPPL
jgi:hypothetical protein